MVNVLCLFITSVILGVSVSAHIIAARRFDVMDPFYLITGLYFWCLSGRRANGLKSVRPIIRV